MRVLRLSLLFVAALALAATAHAGETGSISGVVKDSQGGVLPGATVTVSGDLLPGGLERMTGPNGAFQVQRLLPGTYQVEAAMSGLGTAVVQTRVFVDVDAQLELVLSPTVEETVTVTAEAPVADLKNTEVNFNYDAAEIAKLPLDRTYEGLFQLIPGVADNKGNLTSTPGPAAGGSRQDNMYLIDGVNITNPGFGYLATEVNELDVGEFNVKRGAITAEFGRAAGVVTNAVTRSGTNDFHGRFRFEAIPQSFVSDPKDPDLQEKRDRYIPALSLSGPVVKDKLWWYASARWFRSTLGERTNNTGAIPDEKTSTNEYFGKITSRPTAKHFITSTFRYRPTRIDFAGIGVNDSPELATDFEGKGTIATATWSFFPTESTVIDLKYLHLGEDNEDVAVTDLGERGAFDVNNPGSMGEYFDAAQGITVGGNYLRLNRQNYTRDEIRATYTQFFDWGSTSHQLKAGFGYDWGGEDLTRISNAWGSVSLVQEGLVFNANYYPTQPSQLGNYKSYALFLQDAITIGSRLTINAGVLLNRDQFIQETDQSRVFVGPGCIVPEASSETDCPKGFNFGDQVQPRLGINWNVREGAGDKIYVNWGRYYTLEQKSTARSLAPRRLFTQDTEFDSSSGAILSDAPRASTTGKNLDPRMEPTYQDEWVVGYATPLFGSWGIDVFYMYRKVNNIIEDFPTRAPASGFRYSNLDGTKNPFGGEAKRTYKAFVIDVTKRFSDNWSLNLNYAWSRLEGNFDLDYNNAGSSTRTGSVFNTSSALQDGPGLFVEDPPGFCGIDDPNAGFSADCASREGVLAQDRTHVFKAFATYVPVQGLTLSGYLRIQSGTPWQALGRDWYNGYRRYLEPAGARRNDNWTNFDFLASYRWAIGERSGLTLEARVLNLFNTQTVLFRDQRRFLDGRIRDSGNMPYLVQGTTNPNEDFGEPTEFAPPRRFVLTVLFDF